MSRHTSPALASFMRTAELGSFAAAARELGISAAAVGQNIKRLEDGFGVTLLTRTTRKMSLSPEGVLLYQRLRGPLAELDEIDRIFDESRGVVAGTIRVTAPKRIATRLVVPLMRDFRELHPDVSFDLDASDVVRDFVQDPIDISFRIGPSADSSMISRPLSRLDVMTLGAPDYLAKFGTPTHPQDLTEHECLRYRFPTSRELWLWAFEIDGSVERFDPPGGLVFNDPEALLAAAKAGMGLVQLDGFYGGDAIENCELTQVMPGFTASLFGLHLSYPTRENIPLRVRRFIDFVLRKIERDSFSPKS